MFSDFIFIILVLLHFYCGTNVIVYFFLGVAKNILRPQYVAEYLVHDSEEWNQPDIDLISYDIK